MDMVYRSHNFFSREIPGDNNSVFAGLNPISNPFDIGVDDRSALLLGWGWPRAIWSAYTLRARGGCLPLLAEAFCHPAGIV